MEKVRCKISHFFFKLKVIIKVAFMRVDRNLRKAEARKIIQRFRSNPMLALKKPTRFRLSM